VFRFILWLLRGRSKRRSPDLDRYAVADQGTGQRGEFVTVRLPDGRLVAGERAEPRVGGRNSNSTLVFNSLPDGSGGSPIGPRRARRRRWYSWIPLWLRWTVVIVVLIAFFRRVVAWALLAALSGALHLVGANINLPHVQFGWPWSSLSAPATSSNVLVGPLVLQKIEGINSPALGTTTFNFLFTHKVSHPLGPLPCWYSATFYAVGKASATVDLNPGASWWKPSTGHYELTVLSKPSGATPGQVSVMMTLPDPQLPQSVHDVSIDNTLSTPVSTDHSWTYPGLTCGTIIKPQFAQSVLYAQAQDQAYTQATTVKSVTQPLIAAAEKEATSIIGGNFITPTLNALGYKVTRFTIHWVAPAK
jgi:hypothetical protein